MNLSLRPNFAFYEFRNCNPSQADVFFIFTCLFHVLRNKKLLLKKQKESPKSPIEERFLIQHEHVKSLLDPENFSRYNDGIIQACVLRLARPSELDYSIREEESSKMLNKLKTIFVNGDLESSEAIVEFLYAMATEKLRLTMTHQRDFITHVKNNFSGYQAIDMFITLIEAKL